MKRRVVLVNRCLPSTETATSRRARDRTAASVRSICTPIALELAPAIANFAACRRPRVSTAGRRSDLPSFSLRLQSDLDQAADGAIQMAWRHFTSEEYRPMRRETPSLSISVTPSQLIRWFFRFRSRSAVSYLAMTAAGICPALANQLKSNPGEGTTSASTMAQP